MTPLELQTVALNHIAEVAARQEQIIPRLGCNVCNNEAQYVSAHQLLSHLTGSHRDHPHLCTEPSCLAAYKTAGELKAHLGRTNTARQNKCRAPRCSERRGSLASLIDHYKRTHLVQIPDNFNA